MSGMQKATGKAIEGAAHIAQSIVDILSTPIGSRVMRRDYGSRLAELIDAPLNAATRHLIAAASAGAITRWEPRVTLTRVKIEDPTAGGSLSLRIEGSRTDTPRPEQLSLIVAI